MPPNWNLIHKCPIWPILGVIECDGCSSLVDCWGEETQLPEPNEEAIYGIEALLKAQNNKGEVENG